MIVKVNDLIKAKFHIVIKMFASSYYEPKLFQ